MTQVKMQFTADATFTLTDNGRQYLLALYAKVRADEIPNAPPGFVNAVSKLPDYADDTLIITTVLGEQSADILATFMPEYYPAEEAGISAVFPRTAYQETPAKLDPPADATPLVVSVSNQHVH